MKPTSANSAPAPVPGWMLLATIFVTGNVVMMLEVVGTRVVGPYFGVGLYVWSALITVTLLALAAGYWVGGQLADRRRQPEILYGVIGISAILVLLVPVLRYPLLSAAGGLGMKSGVLLGSTVLFGPALFLLGMVTPYATKLYADQFEKLGSRVGLLYSISTLGSFLGTLTMGFYLIPYFRLATILLALGCTLLLLSLIYFLLVRSRRAPAFAVLLALIGLTVFFYPQSPSALPLGSDLKIVHKQTSFYGEIKVLEKAGHERLMLVDGIIQSGENLSHDGGLPPYVRDMDALTWRYHPKAKRVLLVGLGGGNLVHCFLNRGMSVDVVEIDPQIAKVAERFFGLDPSKIGLSFDDGRHFVRQAKTRYDLIVLNTFTGENFPSHLLTREFFQEVNARLNPGGIVALNFVGYVQGPHRRPAQVIKDTLLAAHAWCHVYFREPRDQFSNILYIAGNGPIPAAPQAEGEHAKAWAELQSLEVKFSGQPGLICTDDYCPVEFMNRVVYRRWRQLMMDSLGPEVMLN